MIDESAGSYVSKLTKDIRALILDFEVKTGLKVDYIGIEHEGHTAGVHLEVKGSYKIEGIKV